MESYLSYISSACQKTGDAVDWSSSRSSNISFYYYSDCYDCCISFANEKAAEDIRNGAMPWIGLYVAVASLICSLAMAADLFLGFRHKKLWFPCKFFTLNALFLTLLAVVTKLVVDLSTDMTDMSYPSDMLAKISSSVFICTVMSNFMPSLGQMNNNQIFMNMAALGVFIVTILVNLLIQLATSYRINYFYFTMQDIPNILITPIMLILFVIMSSSALYVSSAKQYIDFRYHEIHKTSSIEESDVIRNFNVVTLRENVRKYWMMAQTGSPQFVMVRSVACVASGAICVLIVPLLVVIEIDEYYYLPRGHPYPSPSIFTHNTSYKWSTSVIFVIQTIGIGVGTTTCALRVFNTIKLKCSELRGKSFKAEFRIEKYWIEGLVEWKQNPLHLNIRSQKWKKFANNTKNLFLLISIRAQILIVVMSKSIQLLLVFLIAPFLLCYHYGMQLKRKLVPNCTSASFNHSSSESATAREMHLTRYVLLLEGEKELPEIMLNNICDSADRLIQMGRKQQPKNLKELLKKSTSFNGVAEFDNDQIPSLVSYDPPNSWMMPLVTLTGIAIALPNITNRMIEGLINGVSEGLIYIGFVEKELDGKGDLIKVRNAAKVIWLEVELHRTWLDQDLSKMATKEKNSKAILERLANRAKKSVEKFKEKANKIQKENPLQWPVEAIAANSMYRISNTLLLEFDLNNELSEEELFKKLHVMISDILSACLTNLPRVITMKCFCNVVEKREESVQQAAHLLGEAEEILKILQQRELPSLHHDQAACIDECCAIIKQDHNLVFASSSSNNDTASSGSSHEIHLVVEKEAC